MRVTVKKGIVVVFVLNVLPTAKVIWRWGPWLLSDRLVKPGIEPATPGLQGKRFIHYTTAAPKKGIDKCTFTLSQAMHFN